MTYAIDPHNSWLALEQAAENESSERRRQLITEVRNHMEAEINGRLEPLMDTLTAEPIYHFWGRGEPMVLQGREAVEGFYAGMFQTGGEQFEVVVENVIASDQHVVTEGQVKQVYPGATLLAMGVETADGQPIDGDQLYLSNAQLVTVWPADPDGKLVGEDIYFGVDPMATLKPIEREALPPYYKL